MKTPIPSLLAVAGSALALVSCAVPNTQPMQPHANVEALERDTPVTPTPNVGQHEAGRNAVDYANDRTSYDRYGYGRPDGYRRY